MRLGPRRSRGRARFVTFLSTLPLAIVFSGCVDGLRSTSDCGCDDGEKVSDSMICTDPCDAAQLLESYTFTMDKKLYSEHEQFLNSSFQFTPRPDDRADFTWMTGDSWGRATELEIALNLFDPNYSGIQPPIDQISVSATLLSQATHADGSIEVIASFTGQFLTSPVDGFGFDTRLRLTIASEDGSLGIAAIEELDRIPLAPTFTPDDPGLSSASWARIHAAYR